MRIGEKEDKQKICDLMCEAIRATENGGIDDYNSVVALHYVKEEDGEEWVIPEFREGNGKPNENMPHGYYGFRVTCDSGTSMIIDIANQFIRKVW